MSEPSQLNVLPGSLFSDKAALRAFIGGPVWAAITTAMVLRIDRSRAAKAPNGDDSWALLMDLMELSRAAVSSDPVSFCPAPSFELMAAARCLWRLVGAKSQDDLVSLQEAATLIAFVEEACDHLEALESAA